MCGIHGHLAKDCRRKENAQYSKCGQKGLLDRACQRNWDGGKHESVAIGPTLATSDEEYCAGLSQWKAAGILIDSGCTDPIVTNIDTFLDFVPLQSVVRNPNIEASRLMGKGYARISLPSNDGEFQCELYSQLKFGITQFELLNSGKTNSRKWVVIPTLQRSRIQDEFQQHETWQCKDVAQRIGLFESSGCGQECTRDSGGTRWCMHVCALAEIKVSSTKSDRDPRRREAREGVHRRDGTFQSGVTVVADQYRPVCVCGLT